MDSNSLQLLRFIDFADVDDTHGLEYRTLGLLNLLNSIPVAAQGEQIMVLTAIINFKKKLLLRHDSNKLDLEFHQVANII